MKWVLRIAGGLVAVIALAVLVLLGLGMRADAGRTVTTIEIAASPQQVWQWIDDGERMKQWVSWVVAIKAPPGSTAFSAGSKRVVIMSDANNGNQQMSIDAVCTKDQPPVFKEVALSSPNSFAGVQTYRLTDLGSNRTRLEIDGRFHYDMWLAQLMEPLITPAAKKKMEEDMKRLKTLVESAPASALR
jgi:carbon monoxide dehydrogenase subunit G